MPNNRQTKSLSFKGSNRDDEDFQKWTIPDDITQLDLSWNRLGPESAKALSTKSMLRMLDISYTHIGDEGVNYLSQNSSITVLNVSAIRLKDEDAKVLGENNTITALRIANNYLTKEGINCLLTKPFNVFLGINVCC